MRATVLRGPRNVTVENVPDPVLPGPEGAIVTVERTAICGSDLHLYHDAPTGAGIQLGHEAIGSVAEVGPHVRSLRRGDRVLVSGVIGCGICTACQAGQPNVCLADKNAAFGTMPGLPGGQAEAMAVPFADLFALPIPEGLPDEEAVLLTDILPTGYLGALRASIQPGATVVVVGLGPAGIMALQCASPFGPDATIVDAVSCAAPGGTISVVGVNLTMDLLFPMALVFLKSLTLRAVFAPIPGTWPFLVPLLQSGRLTGLGETFTHRMDLSQAPDAYELFDSRADGVLKVLLTPNP